jgi:heme oxygenase
VTLLVRLKTETRLAHERVEEAVNLPARLGSVAAYRALLARLYGFHATWEKEAGAAIPDRALLNGRLRAPALVQDIRALGLSEEEIGRLPECARILSDRTLPEALGAMYVIEGSTLGGAVIAKEVKRTLGFQATSGCSFFAGAGRGLMAQWHGFRDKLLSYSSPDRDDLIVAGAERTFDRMRIWLTQEAVT